MKRARIVHLRRGEATPGLQVCLTLKREIRSGEVIQVEEPRNRYLPRRCTVRVGRNTVQRPETELFHLIETEA